MINIKALEEEVRSKENRLDKLSRRRYLSYSLEKEMNYLHKNCNQLWKEIAQYWRGQINNDGKETTR